MITSTYFAAHKGGIIMCCRPVSPVALKELIKHSTRVTVPEVRNLEFLRFPERMTRN